MRRGRVSSADGSASAAMASAKRSLGRAAAGGLGQAGGEIVPGPVAVVPPSRRRTGLDDARRLLQLGHGLFDVGQRDLADGHDRLISPAARLVARSSSATASLRSNSVRHSARWRSSRRSSVAVRCLALPHSIRRLPGCLFGRLAPRPPIGASSRPSGPIAREPTRPRRSMSRPAGAARSSRERRARTSSARASCSVPNGHGQPLRRGTLLQLAYPQHRFQAEAVGLHEVASSSGTRPSSASVVAGKRAAFADRLTEERVDGGAKRALPGRPGGWYPGRRRRSQ